LGCGMWGLGCRVAGTCNPGPCNECGVWGVGLQGPRATLGGAVRSTRHVRSIKHISIFYAGASCFAPGATLGGAVRSTKHQHLLRLSLLLYTSLSLSAPLPPTPPLCLWLCTCGPQAAGDVEANLFINLSDRTLRVGFVPFHLMRDERFQRRHSGFESQVSGLGVLVRGWDVSSGCRLQGTGVWCRVGGVGLRDGPCPWAIRRMLG
jgi:hypothetical protein